MWCLASLLILKQRMLRVSYTWVCVNTNSTTTFQKNFWMMGDARAHLDTFWLLSLITKSWNFSKGIVIGVSVYHNIMMYKSVKLFNKLWSYLASLVFGKNCRKVGVHFFSTSRPESKKWWHHDDIRHMLQSESSICRGAFPTSWIFIKTLLWHHQVLFI